MNILVIYGLPCSGKSSLLEQLKEYHVIRIDRLITRHIESPSLADFTALSEALMKEIIQIVTERKDSKIVIEMGCLIPQNSVRALEVFFQEEKLDFLNILLTAEKETLISRIERRNKEIKEGKSKAIPIDGPDYLTRFVEFFEKNLPRNAIEINTTIENTSVRTLESLRKAISGVGY